MDFPILLMSENICIIALGPNYKYKHILILSFKRKVIL